MRLAICSILKNEASKWLPATLKAWSDIASIIVALDDGSTDGTVDLLKANPKVLLRHRYGEAMWGNESPARQQLWELAVTESGCNWLLFLDGDMLPANNPWSLFEAPVDAVAFRLYDLWSLYPPMFRHDGHWRGHEHPRVWAVRNPGKDFVAEWNPRGIHCGHLPQNIKLDRILMAPLEYSLLHLAYSDAEARAAKAAQYAAKAALLSCQEQAHAASIEDKLVHCDMLPFGVQWPLSRS